MMRSGVKTWLLVLALVFGCLVTLASAEPGRDIKILGLSLSSKLSDIEAKFGTDHVKGKVQDTFDYFWSEPDLLVSARGETVLRIVGDKVSIDGKKMAAGDVTFASLRELLGKPIAKYHGQHGEPCYVWSGGFQAMSYEGANAESPSHFVLTTRPEIHGDDPITAPVKTR